MNDLDHERVLTDCLRCGGLGVRYNPEHRRWQAQWDRELVPHHTLIKQVPAEHIPCDCRTENEANARLYDLIDAVRDALDQADQATRSWHDSTEASKPPDEQHVTEAITTLSWISAATHHAARRLTAELEVAAPRTAGR
jgi:hypothetical protein